jgi:hypothetical protein
LSTSLEQRTSFKMWRRIYLLLVLVRLYFALSPSYLHPDENFQGPEVIAGMTLYLCIRTSIANNISTRRGLLLPCPPHLGVHSRLPRPQHLSPMARLRSSHGHTPFTLAGYWHRGSATGGLLDPSNSHVHAELRAGGLGNSRAGAIATSKKGGHTTSRVVLRDMDISDTHLFQLH